MQALNAIKNSSRCAKYAHHGGDSENSKRSSNVDTFERKAWSAPTSEGTSQVSPVLKLPGEG